MAEEAIKKVPDIGCLSRRMFWDTPIENIHWFDHRGFIIERVMRYGRFEDWELIKQWYGRDMMRETVVQLRDLDDISIAFLSLVLSLEKEDFRCYIEKQSRPSFWDS